MSRTSFEMTVAALVVAFVVGGLSLSRTGHAQGGQPGAEPAVKLTKEFLTDPANVEKGYDLFQGRCKFCHGRSAYPGKAPKLEPSRYTPEFVYDRVTNGFGGMPSWKHEFDEEQRKQIVSYVMSPDFSN